ncbi:hypothetical protein LTS18_014537 [Coniosporium uncinatum]|uniref:Uncharacterized protein n=1 Tax=Coniosporium uncinatum TaxID=93489 RepID=A0ACC3D8S0_9PEZI|nr:hypothetical protein LTS18_014537 [Coniosporium uncinatum]
MQYNYRNLPKHHRIVSDLPNTTAPSHDPTASSTTSTDRAQSTPAQANMASKDQVKYTNKLDNTNILILGGSSGLGYGVAEACLEYNAAHVYISSSSPQRVDKAVKSLQASYPSKSDRVHGHACDLGDEKTLEDNIKQLLEKVARTKKLDHIVFTAGDALAQMALKDVSLEKIQKAGMVRFYAPLLLAKHAPGFMMPGPHSSITLTTGNVFEKPMPDWSVIGAYAGGLMSMTKNLALDLKPIRVNLVSPGAVETELWNGMPEEQRKAFLKSHGEKMATGRIGQVADVVEGYLFAMRDENATAGLIQTNSGALIV